MQTLLFSKIIDVLPHIEFDCTVNGKELTATLTHTEDNGVQTLYHVSFSDGHRDAYAPGEGELHEGFGRTRHMDEYEAAVFDDLRVLPCFHKGEGHVYIRVHVQGASSFNVWVRERKGYHSVYCQGAYQFTLRKNGGWHVSTMREKGYRVNQQLACLVCRHLDQHAR